MTNCNLKKNKNLRKCSKRIINNNMKVNDKVLFKSENVFTSFGIGSDKAIGHIRDFDGEYVIIETGIGENYINKKDILKKLKNRKN